MRVAVASDAAAVAHVHQHSRAAYYGSHADADDDRDAMWRHLLAEPDRTTVLAESADDVVGFASWVRPESGPAELTALYVLPAWFGRGVGSRLHEAFDDACGEVASSLEVWAGNDRALSFYRRRGWEPTSERRPGPDGVHFVTYRRPAGSVR